TAWAVGQTTGDPARKMVLMALANRHNPDDGLCCPSHELLAEEAEMHQSTLRRHLRALEEAGLIRRKRRSDARGHRISDAYEFVGFVFRPARQSRAEAEAKRAKRAVGGEGAKRAKRAVGIDEAKRADCAVGPVENQNPNAQPTAQLCALHIEPKPTEPNLSTESQNTKPREAPTLGDTALALLRQEIGLAVFNSWFKDASLAAPDDASAPAALIVPTTFIANYIRQNFGERLERLLGRRIEYAALEPPPSGAAAHGVRVIGSGDGDGRRQS
ncbi:helix-turn-helix domain-containing protein, partial [Parvibaculum sp.]